ncbi:MAG: DNA-directed RNA polymerase subunit omega [Planctomycetes bacterium]|nr:DNA-directed RNA polymerase subunit omega [Planctomycetota bacterium]
MIEALKSDKVVQKVGGRFKLAVLVQKRLVDVTFGAPLLVERGDRTLMEAVVQEVLEGKITLEAPEKIARETLRGEVEDEADEQ